MATAVATPNQAKTIEVEPQGEPAKPKRVRRAKPGPQSATLAVVSTAPDWERDEKLKAALKQVYAPKATDEQFLVFLNECKRREAIPGKHIHFRLQKQKEKERLPSGQVLEKWVEKPIFITSIDFFRLIAQRTGKYAGQKRLAWYYRDGNQKPTIRLEIPDEQMQPYAAEATVLRHGFSEPMVRVARYAAFVQTYRQGDHEVPNQMWQRMGPEQLAKCAEAQALRAAFPEELGGLYVSEEIPYEESELIAPPMQIDASVASQKVSTGDLSVSQDTPKENPKSQDSGQRQNATERTTPQTQAASEPTPTPACAPVAVPDSVPAAAANAKECPLCGSTQHGDGPCPYAKSNGVPRAELPDPQKIMEPSGPQGSLNVTSDASAVPSTSAAQPTNGGAKGQAQTAPPKTSSFVPSKSEKFGERFYAVQEHVFGSRNAADRLLYYLIFAVPPTTPAVDVEIKGAWNAAKWNTTVKALPDRAGRLAQIEEVLAQEGRETFIKWAKALVDAARARKTFKQ